MKRAKLTRQPSTDEGTFGVFSFGSTIIKSLELPWRDNIFQKSCIPTGLYTCSLVLSPKFGRVYEVKNVSNRSNVLIHSANLAGNIDLGYTTQLQGCIAPHEKSGFMKNNAGKMQRAGLISRPALTKLMVWAANQNFELEIS